VKTQHVEFYETHLKEKAPKPAPKPAPAKPTPGKTTTPATDQSPSTSRVEPKKKRQKTLFEVGFENPTLIEANLHFETVRLACVEMVTVNGRPLSIVADSGFRKILDPILDAMPGSVSINPHNIRDGVHEIATKLREMIKVEVKNKLVSVKVDGASRLDRSVLGVNIQYINDGKIVLRTLAVRELFEKHTSSHLRDVILDILKEFDIGANQIYTITTDNGANMVRAVQIMMEEDDETNQNEEVLGLYSVTFHSGEMK
jgi:hypothetical protein